MTPTKDTPFRLGGLALPHRLVMAPMTRNRAAADGTPTALMAAYYAQRAADAYGGSVAGRIRFVAEAVEAVAAEIGAERVGVRVSPGLTVNGIEEGDTEELYPALVERLKGLRLAYLHVVYADPQSPVFRRIRAEWPGAVIANPVLPELTADAVNDAVDRLLAAGADLVALGRPFLANPDLVERLRQGAPLNPVRDRYLMYVGGAAGYTDYPALADEPGQPSSDSMVAWEGARVA